MKKIKPKIFLLAVFLCVITSFGAIKTATVDCEPQKNELVVIMYHSFLKDSSKSGKYIITPSQFENDIIYLKSIGCSFVSVNDIAKFRKGTGSLPERAVLITLDDGNYNNYSYIFPLLKKYSVPALFSPIGYWVEQYTQSGEKNPVYSIVTESEISEMYSSGLVEIGNHTYNLHGTDGRLGCKKLNGESTDSYRQMLKSDLAKANEIIRRCTGENPCALVYPYGAICPDSYAVAKNLGFDILFSCTEGINHIAPTDELYVLKRFNRPFGKNSADFFEEIYK